jgi:hypothetical protein
MTTAVTLPDDLLREVESHAAREGSDLNEAIAALLRIGLTKTTVASSTPDEAMLQRRRELTQKFISGEWGVELNGYEEGRSVDRRKATERSNAWRE